ncbi:MAG: hypothetical protein KatS3mg110_1224 [Pirellulaceae bacterium]|nr:MAG: hypothetical protein KatS3mg110_1224 [Pirellulaceae bacterium]
MPPKHDHASIFDNRQSHPTISRVHVEKLTPESLRYRYVAFVRDTEQSGHAIYFGRDKARAIGYPVKGSIPREDIAAFGIVRHGDFDTVLIWERLAEKTGSNNREQRPPPEPPPGQDSGWLREFHQHHYVGVLGIWLRTRQQEIPDLAELMTDLDFPVYEFESWAAYWRAIGR